MPIYKIVLKNQTKTATKNKEIEMNKQEFCDRTTAKYENLNENDWNVISTVYAYHPVISNVNGKDEIAALYNQGGLGLLQDMYNTANAIQLNEMAIQKASVDLENMTKKHQANLKKLDEIYQTKTGEIRQGILDSMEGNHIIEGRYK